MFWLILGLLVTVVLFVALGFKEVTIPAKNMYEREKTEIQWSLSKRQVFALVGLLICLFGFYVKIPDNSVGIVYSPFNGTKTEALSEGFHAKSPFDKVYKISTLTQSMTVKDLTTQTKDAQYLTSQLDIKYKVDSTNAYIVFKQYRTLDNMSKNMIIPITQKVLELVTTQYNIIDILGEKRSEVYTKLDLALAEEFAKYGVEFVSISISDMDAGEALEKAISDEAVAKKAVETAEQNLKKAEIDAKQQSVLAQAEQDAAKIKAETMKIEAQAQKEANELLNFSLSDLILQQQWIEKWDGKMPTYYGGDSTLMVGMD
jgi:regulator of protease activity HflC (stomatin/prohibitin superfamily)